MPFYLLYNVFLAAWIKTFLVVENVCLSKINILVCVNSLATTCKQTCQSCNTV